MFLIVLFLIRKNWPSQDTAQLHEAEVKVTFLTEMDVLYTVLYTHQKKTVLYTHQKTKKSKTWQDRTPRLPTGSSFRLRSGRHSRLHQRPPRPTWQLMPRQEAGLSPVLLRQQGMTTLHGQQQGEATLHGQQVLAHPTLIFLGAQGKRGSDLTP